MTKHLPLTDAELLDVVDCEDSPDHGKPWKEIIRRYWDRDREMLDAIWKELGGFHVSKSRDKDFHRVARQLFHYREVFKHFGNVDLTQEIK